MANHTSGLIGQKWRGWRFLVVVPLFVLVAAFVGLEISGRVSLSRALQTARAAQEPFTFEEILERRRAWPPEQDGGYVFSLLCSPLTELRKDSRLLSTLPIVGGVEVPPLGRRWPQQVQAAVNVELATILVVIDGLDRLRGYPGGNLPFVIPRDYEQAEEVVLPELAALRFAVKLKSLQAMARAMQGDTSHIVDDTAVMVRLAGLLSDRPMVISSLQKIACDSHVADTMEQVLAVAPIVPVDLSSLEALLAETEAIDPMYWGVLGERALFFSSAEQTLQRGAGRGVSGWIRRDEAYCLGLFNRLAGVAKMSRGRPEAAIQLGQEALALPPRYSLTRTSFPSLGRAFTLSMVSTAQLRTARTGLAVERYRLETGGFPQQLDQLVPKYLGQVPLDPFDEKPLRYRLTDKSAKIYSIGEDGVDDGGDLAEQRDKKPGGDCGFVLLRPEFRNLPPVPTTQSGASKPVTTREAGAG